MNQPFSRGPDSTEQVPLAARYRSAKPIRWNGSKIYPMYIEKFAGAPKLLAMATLSAAPPPGLRGYGLGLSVFEGYVALEGRRLSGVDIWSDALHGGVVFELMPTGPEALFTVTPVWVDALGVQKSWVGNYGILVEDVPDRRIALWCSIGEGPPNFANLVVALLTEAAPAREEGDPEATAEAEVEQSVQAPDVSESTDGAVAETVEDPRTAPLRRPLIVEALDAQVTRPLPTRARVRVDAETSASVSDPADPGYRGALYDLGVAMFRQGEEEQACGLWAQAAAGGHAGAAHDLGVVRRQRGDCAGAEHWWRVAADLREPQAMTALAVLLEERGESREARRWRVAAAEARAAAAVSDRDGPAWSGPA